MSVSEIPLSPQPQRFFISLNGVQYQLRFTWNVPSSAWIMDIATGGGVALAQGIPLVTADDLLEQFEYLGLGGAMYVRSDDNPTAVPTYENLGTQGHLLFVTP